MSRAFSVARKRPLVPILIVALGLRVGLVAATGEQVPWGDPIDYHKHAAFLAELGNYPPSTQAAPDSPAAFRPPAWPYLLAGVYEVTGVHWTAARLTAAVLGALTVLLVYGIAGALFGHVAARWAGWLAAVFPPMVFLSGSPVVENLFVLVMLVAVFATLRARAGPHSLRWALVAGAACGLGALTRPNGLVLVVPVVLGLAAGAGFSLRRPSMRPLVAPALAVVVMVLTMAPWAVRNAAAFGEFVPVSTQGGYSMAQVWNGVSDSPGPRRGAPEFTLIEPYQHQYGIDEVELDRKFREMALDYAYEHPGYVIELAGRNVLRMFKLDGDDSFTYYWNRERDMTAWRRVLDSIGLAAIVMLVLVAVVGRRSRRRLRESPRWLWLVPALILVSTMFLFGNPRHRASIDPFLVLAATVGAMMLRDRLRTRLPSPSGRSASRGARRARTRSARA